MSTAVAPRPTLRSGTVAPAAVRIRALPRVERVLYMCAAAQVKERRGDPAARFHANCRGRAFNGTPALTGVTDPDGRFRAGRHVCVCPCHDAPARRRGTAAAPHTPLTMPRRHR